MIEGWDEMSDAERRNTLWGLRVGSEPHINRIRREQFEGVKCLITERDLPKTVTTPPAGVTRMRVHFVGGGRGWMG